MGCWDPRLCSEDAKIGYTKYECTKVVKCNTGWCDYGEICCEGMCTPQSTGSSTSFWWCGKQWYSDDLELATEL